MADEKGKRKRKNERPDALIQVSFQVGFKADGKSDGKYFYGHLRAKTIGKRDGYKKMRDPRVSFADLSTKTIFRANVAAYEKPGRECPRRGGIR